MLQSLDCNNFDVAFKFGEEGEMKVASLLIDRGVLVSPLYQFETKSGAPFAISKFGKITLPDLSCWSKGQPFFVECKRKNQWVKNFRGLETGLDQKHYEEYKIIKNNTGQKVYIFFVHEIEHPGVFYNEIDNLESNARRWCGKYNGRRISKPLVFFQKEKLIQIQ